ncbi:fasciclin-like arabinogalactan protein 6 [Telopea speciosissima]|uniref:fasciclin-like arabinogalactan protein 6 n=1 Tax=Telopea speciosissima TaxID=54955 RepID=UPI001CC69D4D|nr:fasciclin-like arabinogalactan protein 6 [Telopea speciosissima]
MASTSPLVAILLTLIPCLFLIIPQAQAQTTAPAPDSNSVLNLTAVLEKGGQYSMFSRLLNTTGVMSQLQIQLNNPNGQGFTIFAPTDNAFSYLKPGTINSLSQQDQVELLQYHVLPQYYTLSDLQTVSNPVRTQGNSQNGNDNLNFTSSGNNQLNISTGVVTTPVNNPLRVQSPLAVYEVDKVLLPMSLFGVPAPSVAPHPAIASNTTSTPSVSSGGGEPVASPKSSSIGLCVDRIMWSCNIRESKCTNSNFGSSGQLASEVGSGGAGGDLVLIIVAPIRCDSGTGRRRSKTIRI